MPTSPSTRLGLVGPAGTDTIAQGDDQIRAIITQLEAVGAGFEQGTSRPAAAAALAGYFYVNTSTGLVSYCTGSVWLDFPTDGSVTRAKLATSLIQTKRGVALTLAAGTPTPVTVSFAQAFADTNYSVTATCVDAAVGACITAKSASQVTVSAAAGSGFNGTCHVDIVAWHD